MKNKSYLLIFSLFALVSCGTRLTNPQIPELTEFEDENLNNAIRVSEQKKKEIKEDVHNIYMEEYIPYITGENEFEYSKEYAINNSINCPTYHDVDNNYLEMRVLGYDLAIQKINGEIVKNGSYFDLVGDIFDENYYNSLFEFDENIYSWDILDLVKSMTVPQTETSVSIMGATEVSTASNQKFYENLTCTRDDGNGNFAVTIDGEISYVNNQKITIPDNEGGTIEIESSTLVNTKRMDVEYVDHKVSEILIHMEMFHEPKFDENDEMVSYDSATQILLYLKYQYNVGEDVFVPTYLAK